MIRSWAALREHLEQPVDAASVAVVRAALGLMMMVGVVRLYAHGWVEQLYIRPLHHFSYWGLEFVKPLPAPWIHVHLAMLALCCIGVALGAFHRMSSVGFCLLFGWLEFSEKATYLNHYYLVSCLSVAMVFLPVASGYSVDAWRRGRWAGTVPRWVPWFFRIQLSWVYFCAGVAKVGPDWLERGQPLTLWFSNMQDVPLIGPLLAAPMTGLLMSWAGCAFDLSAGVVMLLPRFRGPFYAAVVVFHALTGFLFNIGMFPWLMIGLTTVYFDFSWPRRWLLRWGQSRISSDARAPLGVITLAALALYVLVQVVMPFRHLAYNGNVLWHEQGFRYAWKVMLIEKAGDVSFRVVDPASGKHWVAEPNAYFSPLQVKSMSTQPDMILQAAHVVASDYAARGYPEVQVFADAFVAFNGRSNSRLIDSKVDLARERDNLSGKAWILPLNAEPLQRQREHVAP